MIEPTGINMSNANVSAVSKKRYSVRIEGLEDEITDIMYGAGMTDFIALFETDDLEDKSQIFKGLAAGWEQPKHVPAEELQAFVNELGFLAEKAKDSLLKRGSFLIDGDYWVVSVVDNSFKPRKDSAANKTL
jgi:hypothetical protein